MQLHGSTLSGIDLFKLIASLLVVMCHIGLLGSYSVTANRFLVNTIFRWSVPFFFLVSGYFLPGSVKKLVRYCGRILLLYGVWSLFQALARGADLRFFLQNLFPTNGYAYPFWYFPSLLACAVFTFVLKRLFRGRYALLLLFTFGLYMVGSLGDSYSALLPDNPLLALHVQTWHGTTRNGLFFGTFFLCLGSFLRDSGLVSALEPVLSRRALVCGVCAGLGLSFLEYWICHHFSTGIDFNVTYSAIPLCLTLFLLALRLRLPRNLSLTLRRMSTLVYVIHPFFLIDGVKESFSNSVVFFLVAAGSSLVLSALFLLLSRKIPLLRFLY